MSEVLLKLAFPPAEVRPNAREHWAVKAAAVKEYRHAAKVAAKDYRNTHDGIGPLTAPVTYSMTFVCQSRGPLPDEDNMVASMKAALDGLVESGLLISDRPEHLHLGTIHVRKRAPYEKDAYVLVQLKESA